MKSVNGLEWQISYVPERLIIKNKQNYNISYLLSKIFLDKKYTDEEIYYSINKSQKKEVNYLNKDFIAASNFIKNCVKKRKKILIFGDYDVDGYSSTYLLFDYFNKLNIDCNYFVPNRALDGYGPNVDLLKKLIKPNNYGLIIFVDCGSNSTNEINYLESKNIASIIIDHHQIYNNTNYNNSIIINPLKSLKINNYFFLCATSLVFFFIKYLMNTFKINKKIDLNKYLFFSAIATICDQMPLRDYNKYIVYNGLKNFDLNKFVNIKKLINLKDKITASDVAFNLGPILNSASRLGKSDLPLKLLIENQIKNIDKIIIKLMNLNERRKQIQIKTINLLKSKNDIINQDIIFKYETNINEGLLGIVASNFVELYNRPSFILTNSGNIIKCSSRSIIGFDVGKIFYSALKKKIILKGGGHSMAAGCTLKKDKLNEFKNFLNYQYLKKFKRINNIKNYISIQNFDSLKSFSKDELQYLEPFGNNNINPFFLVEKIKIIKFKILKNLHLQLLITNKYKKSCICFAFNVINTKLGDILMSNKKEIDLIVQINNKIIRKSSDFNLIIKDAILH